MGWCLCLPFNSGCFYRSLTTLRCLSLSSATANDAFPLLAGRRFRPCFSERLSTFVESENVILPQIRSPGLVAMEYEELNLSHKVSEDLGHVRIRQHVNPLSRSFSTPAEIPKWNEVIKDPNLPLMIDIGSGSGRFLLWLARRNLGLRNYLGLEIRKKLVKRAEFWVKELGLNNIHFMVANATNSFEQLVNSYPGPLMLVSILCPDPHFKKRHHKRRVVQKPLVDSIVESLALGGQVFIQSDVVEVAEDMRNQFDSKANVLKHIDCTDSGVELCDSDGWLLSNPMGIRTEREIHAEFEGAKTQQERADNCALRAENDRIRCENIAIREALKNVICPSCGGPPNTADSYFDE